MSIIVAGINNECSLVDFSELGQVMFLHREMVCHRALWAKICGKDEACLLCVRSILKLIADQHKISKVDTDKVMQHL